MRSRSGQAVAAVFTDAELAWLLPLDPYLDSPEPVEDLSFADDLDEGFEDRHLSTVRHCEVMIAKWQGRQLKAMAAHCAYVEAGCREAGMWTSQALDSAAAEIALALKVAPITAGSRLGDAIDLSQRLPATLEALCAGRITLPKARAVSAETVNLSEATRAQVEVEALATASGMTPGKLRGNVRRIIERLDPTGLVDRTAKARAERGVSLYPEPDGVATISADMPIEQALAVYGVIDSLAQSMLNQPGEERTIDQLRSDVLFDLICHPPTGSSRIDYNRLNRAEREPASLRAGSRSRGD
jgi:hypothetical protein